MSDSDGFMSDAFEYATDPATTPPDAGGEWVTGVTGEDVWVNADGSFGDGPADDGGGFLGGLGEALGSVGDVIGDVAGDVFGDGDPWGEASGGGGILDQIGAVFDDAPGTDWTEMEVAGSGETGGQGDWESGADYDTFTGE